jgi:hypothetical protein
MAKLIVLVLCVFLSTCRAYEPHDRVIAPSPPPVPVFTVTADPVAAREGDPVMFCASLTTQPIVGTSWDFMIDGRIDVRVLNSCFTTPFYGFAGYMPVRAIATAADGGLWVGATTVFIVER